jgi:hypothetical protein
LKNGFSSPDCSGKPTAKNNYFSWQKRATGRSSFCDLEKQSFLRGLVTKSGTRAPSELAKQTAPENIKYFIQKYLTHFGNGLG